MLRIDFSLGLQMQNTFNVLIFSKEKLQLYDNWMAGLERTYIMKLDVL